MTISYLPQTAFGFCGFYVAKGWNLPNTPMKKNRTGGAIFGGIKQSCFQLFCFANSI